MEMPSDTPSLLSIAAFFLLPDCLIVVEEAGKLREFKRIDAEAEKREKNAKDFWRDK